MQIIKDTSKLPFRIRSYEPGKIIINDQELTRSVLISKKDLYTNWAPQQFSDLTVADFDRLSSLETKLIIFGTGETQHFPHPSLYENLLRKGIMIEFMRTKSAAYTFNILISENRDVACALLL